MCESSPNAYVIKDKLQLRFLEIFNAHKRSHTSLYFALKKSFNMKVPKMRKKNDDIQPDFNFETYLNSLFFFLGYVGSGFSICCIFFKIIIECQTDKKRTNDSNIFSKLKLAIWKYINFSSSYCSKCMKNDLLSRPINNIISILNIISKMNILVSI